MATSSTQILVSKAILQQNELGLLGHMADSRLEQGISNMEHLIVQTSKGVLKKPHNSRVCQRDTGVN